MQEHWKPASEDRALDLLGELSSEIEAGDGARPGNSSTQTAPASSPDPIQVQALQRLKSLRKSPGFKLATASLLFLRAWQLDMDYPPTLRAYVRQRLDELLKEHHPEALSPDDIQITFMTDNDPAITHDGSEHFSLSLTLTELGMIGFDTRYFLTLSRCPVKDDALSPPLPDLPASRLIALLRDSAWNVTYEACFRRFWTDHETTYRALSKLAFLDQLARQFSRKKISREGYHLALDTLGLSSFPTSVHCLTDTARGGLADVYMLAVNGKPVPGLFQLRSKNTSHCFIHVLGSPHITEYISDDPRQMATRLLDAVKMTPGLLHLPDDVSSGIQASATVVEGDVFDALTRVQKERHVIEVSDDPLGQPIAIDVLRPIKRSLALISAVDLYPVQPGLLRHIPDVQRSAAQAMGSALFSRYGLTLNPHHVFVRYLPGTSTTPLGSARQPSNFVHVPDTDPLSLGQALIDNYRVEQPVGYLDHGGRSVVYLDPTGQGEWAPGQALSISAEAIEETVKSIDFLSLMSAQVTHFWEQHKDSIEHAFETALMAQAVIALKRGNLTRSAFDSVVEALAGSDQMQWQALGFNVYSRLFDGVERQYCAGLLVLETRGKPGRILYQAASARGFMAFANHAQLIDHLRNSAADAQWRQSVLEYIPARHQQRLDYLLRIWGGEPPFDHPVSLLRPWTHGIYNPDVQDAKAYRLYETTLIDSPFGFMRQTLQDNQLREAQTQIVTSGEVSLRFWTRQLSHLQLLLAPLSILLIPAALTSLALEVGLLSLHIASANLPGDRAEEKQQAWLAALTLGLLDLSPATPRLLYSLKRVVTARRIAARGVPGGRGFTAALNHWTHPRRTYLQRFFHTNSLLKGWTVPASPPLWPLPVKAWKLGRKFLLWTSNKSQATTLLVSTHGHYMPWTRTVALPNGTTLHTYAPHGHTLIDPGLHHVAYRRVKAFALSNSAGNTPIPPAPSQPPLVLTDKLMAGTSLPGHMKNYVLGKYQGARETYDDIYDVINNTRRAPFKGQLPLTPIDVLTIRNRFGMAAPDLEELFRMLFDKGIHYDTILLVHCRCKALDSLLDRGPSYTAPRVPPRTTP